MSNLEAKIKKTDEEIKTFVAQGTARGIDFEIAHVRTKPNPARDCTANVIMRLCLFAKLPCPPSRKELQPNGQVQGTAGPMMEIVCFLGSRRLDLTCQAMKKKKMYEQQRVSFSGVGSMWCSTRSVKSQGLLCAGARISCSVRSRELGDSRRCSRLTGCELRIDSLNIRTDFS